MSIHSVDQESTVTDALSIELLIKEARRKARRRRLTVSAICLALVVLAVTLVGITPGPRNAHKTTTAGTGDAPAAKYRVSNVANLAGSTAFAASGSRIWVTISRESPTRNFYAVTELNASSSSLVRVIKDRGPGPLGNEKNKPQGDLIEPGTATLSGSHLWVADDQYSKVTELNASSGSLIRVIGAKADGLENPGSIVVSGGHVWVTNNESVTELNENDGSLVKVLDSKS